MDAVKLRDDRIKKRQVKISAALSSVVETFFMVGKSLGIPERQAVSEKFDDTMILIADLQNDESVIRRNLISANMDNKMKEPLFATPITGELFGDDLAKTVEAAKAIQTTEKNLKKVVKTFPPKT